LKKLPKDESGMRKEISLQISSFIPTSANVLYHGNSQLDFGDALPAKGLAPTSSLTFLENTRS
jgi:hypothetical protein